MPEVLSAPRVITGAETVTGLAATAIRGPRARPLAMASRTTTAR